MREKHVLIVSAIFLFGLGLMLVLLPDQILSLLNIQWASTRVIRILGAALLIFGVLNWVTRHLEEYRLKPIIVANLIFYFLGFVIMLVDYLAGNSTEHIWLISGLFLLMTIAFGYAYCCLQVWAYLTGKLS